MTTTDVFPTLTRADVLEFQFSEWYPKFKQLTFKSTIIRPLGEEFHRYLLSEGVHIPKGSENVCVHILMSQETAGKLMKLNVKSAEDDELSEEESDEEVDADEPQERFSFPVLDAQIRQVIADYGAVFPKLNFTSPKDASWLLPSSSPMKCTSPMDIYMLLKSSDFVSHDISPENVFEGCSPGDEPYFLELVLRRWYHVDPGRELRCFVRDGVLIGITQRDTNYYEHLNDSDTQYMIIDTIGEFWDKNIKHKWPTADYTFDLVLTRNLRSAHIIDFNPYAPRTDSLLFSYEELYDIYHSHVESPTLKVIDSRAHPAVTRNAPSNAHNMVPFGLLSLSAGQTIDDFADAWRDKVQEAMEDSD